MSGFNSKCLVRISDILNESVEDFKKALQEDREVTYERLSKDVGNHVTDYENPDGDCLIGYLPTDAWCGEVADAIFGCEQPEKLLAFADGMKGHAKDAALFSIVNAGYSLKSTFDDVLKDDMDTVRTFQLRQAVEILDGKVNSECSQMFYSLDGYWKPWPDDYELESIKQYPENWAVVELLFKD